MDVYLSIDGPASGDLTRDLRAWLVAERGQWEKVRVAEREPVPDTLGPVADAVQLAVGSISALSSLATVIMAWLQYRKPDVTITLGTGDQGSSLQVQASHAQADHEAARDELTEWLAQVMRAESSYESGSEDGS